LDGNTLTPLTYNASTQALTCNYITSNTTNTQNIILPTYTGLAIILQGIYYDGTDYQFKILTGDSVFGTIRSSYIQRDVAVMTRYKSGPQTVTAPSNPTTVVFETLDSDNSQGTTGLTYSAGTFTNNISSSTKTYLVEFTINSQGGELNKDRAVWIQKSTSSIRYGNTQIVVNALTELELICSSTIVLVAGASFTCRVYNASATTSITLNYSPTIGRTNVCITLL
jgi:hypothetical protein